MTHSRTRRNMHVPAWQLRHSPRGAMKPACNHRHGWNTQEVGGRVVDVCRRCGATRQVQA